MRIELASLLTFSCSIRRLYHAWTECEVAVKKRKSDGSC
eukprot:SAG31_NODE_23822_length_494_cov_9.481013_1_plen_38_part_10